MAAASAGRPPRRRRIGSFASATPSTTVPAEFFDAFCRGEPSLDTWLRDQAVPATARRTARTWACVEEAGAVVGYYALAAHKVAAISSERDRSGQARWTTGGPAGPSRRIPDGLLLVQKVADVEAALMDSH